jgi:hypothetical protein
LNTIEPLAWLTDVLERLILAMLGRRYGLAE